MHEDLLDDFLAEATDHIERSEQELLALESFDGTPEETLDLLNMLFRAVHSIKGAADFLELHGIVEVTHAMESIFGKLRERKEKPNRSCADLMLTGLDVLRNMLGNIHDTSSVDSQDIALRLRQHEKQMTGVADVAVISTSSVGIPKFGSKEISRGYCYSIIAPDLHAAEKEIEGIATIEGMLNGELYASSVLESDLLYSAIGQPSAQVISIGRDELNNRLSASKPLKKNEIVTTSSQTMPANTELEKPNLSSAPAVREAASSSTTSIFAKPASIENSVRVDLNLLENLMALAGELVLVRNRHLCWVSGMNGHPNYESGREIAQRMDTVTTELQTAIMKTRMQPLERVFGKLPRLVRDVARQLNKEIALDVIGAEVEVDRAILESLGDPLTHLLRNSCDHGIELPKIRQEHGKSTTGTVHVHASHESGQIRIEVSDDGKGINPEQIAKSAIKKGLVTEDEVASMDTRRKLALIMLPGFSTAEKVSNISGRGVGMDVVKSSIEKLGGTVDIDSSPGQGSRFILRLPLTLAIIQSLVVCEDKQRYLIPRINLEEVINLVGFEIEQRVHIAAGQEVIEYHRGLLQLVRLGDVLQNRDPFTADDRSRIAQRYKKKNEESKQTGHNETLDIAVVRVGEYRYGLVVQETLEMEEIVVKPLHPAQDQIAIFIGVTVTGDGRIAPILDVEGIANHSLDEVRYSSRRDDDEKEFRARSDEAQKILLFENAPGEMFAIGLAFIQRICTVASDCIEHVGNKQYAKIGGKAVVVARLEKILDVKPCLEKDEMYLILPRFGNEECGILASSIYGIGEIAANFNHEMNQHEEGSLGTAIINGMTTTFPDIYYVCECTLNAGLQNRHGALLAPYEHTRLAPAIAHDARQKAKRILLAEDAPFFRHLIMSYLKREHLQVDTARDGLQAWEMIRSKSYDLILSDIEMPLMDGRELARRIRSDDAYKNLPVIALTSLDTAEDRKECLGAGFSEYIIKLNREQLLCTLNCYLAS